MATRISHPTEAHTKSAIPGFAGVLAAFGAVVIWAAWIVGTRQAVTHALDPLAVGFLRFAVPAVVLAPVWWRIGLRPRSVSIATLLALMGAGAPFFVTVAIAMRHASAAEIGPLLPGTMPLIVTVLSVVLFRERLSRSRGAGGAVVAVGIAVIGGADMLAGAQNWLVHGLLLTGAGMWAAYTIAYKHSGLSSIAATAVVSAWSALALAPFGLPPLIAAVHSGLGGAVIVQAVIQGLLSGVLAILLYGFAVSRLGATVGASFVALVPALAALIAIPVLGEVPSTASMIGIGATTLGVALMTGAISMLPRPNWTRLSFAHRHPSPEALSSSQR
jgi:drug/metabolite transporter (DMT)-like permease